jgi:hypothetical protein
MTALIADALQRLSQSFPPSLPMVNQMNDLLQQIESKVAETVAPTQPQAPPI